MLNPIKQSGIRKHAVRYSLAAIALFACLALIVSLALLKFAKHTGAQSAAVSLSEDGTRVINAGALKPILLTSSADATPLTGRIITENESSRINGHSVNEFQACQGYYVVSNNLQLLDAYNERIHQRAKALGLHEKTAPISSDPCQFLAEADRVLVVE